VRVGVPPTRSASIPKYTICRRSEHLNDLNNKITIKNHKINLSNLTPIQSRALNDLKQNEQLIIKPTDKNLGPALMDLNSCILQVLQEHLLTKDKWERLGAHLTSNQLLLPQSTCGQSQPTRSVSRYIFNNIRFLFCAFVQVKYLLCNVWSIQKGVVQRLTLNTRCVMHSMF
jgi:hypothetical protein